MSLLVVKPVRIPGLVSFFKELFIIPGSTIWNVSLAR